MDKEEGCKEFLDILFFRTEEVYKTTKEYEYQQEREEELKEFLQNNLRPSEKPIVEEILCKFWGDSEYRKYRFYQQGFYDCLWVLKSMFFNSKF